MRYLVLALSVFTLVATVMCAGCDTSSSSSQKADLSMLTGAEARARYFDEATVSVTVVGDEYVVMDSEQFVLFSSAPLVGDSSPQSEKRYLHEYVTVVKAAEKWMNEHPDVHVKLADVTERGGNHESGGTHDAFYTVRILLLKE